MSKTYTSVNLWPTYVLFDDEVFGVVKGDHAMLRYDDGSKEMRIDELPQHRIDELLSNNTIKECKL